MKKISIIVLVLLLSVVTFGQEVKYPYQSSFKHVHGRDSVYSKKGWFRQLQIGGYDVGVIIDTLVGGGVLITSPKGNIFKISDEDSTMSLITAGGGTLFIDDKDSTLLFSFGDDSTKFQDGKMIIYGENSDVTIGDDGVSMGDTDDRFEVAGVTMVANQLKLGNGSVSDIEEAGMFRFVSPYFQIYDGSQWTNLNTLTAPTIDLQTSGYSAAKEVGTSTAITLRAITTNGISATLSNGLLKITSTTPDTNLLTWTTGTDNTYDILFTPKQSAADTFEYRSYTFQATHDYAKGALTGTATDNVTITAYYPFFYGISSSDYTAASGTTIYSSGLTKVVQAQGTKSLTFTGTGYMYIIVPATWSDISSVKDETGSTVAGFTKTTITVTSTGLTNDYSNVSYECWISPSIGTFTGQTYTIAF